MACFKVFILLIVCVVLQEGFGLPLAESQTQGPTRRRVRTKRCSCNNWEDKECIYFCHLDIIWVNTPSKLLPYGLGSPSSRRRRSAERCECLNSADGTCRDFCRKSLDDGENGARSQFRNKDSHTMLDALRAVVKSNLAMGKTSRLQRRATLGFGKEKE